VTTTSTGTTIWCWKNTNVKHDRPARKETAATPRRKKGAFEVRRFIRGGVVGGGER
jgi:hypothetical protein